jgi:hypothetical protein
LKRLLRPVGFVLGLVATAAFAWYAARVLEAQDLSRFATPQGIAAVALAALCYATIIPTSALAWGTLLRGLGAPHPRRSLVEILAISQFAKYIPGNVGAHLGRAGMAVARGIATRAVVASLLAETVLAVAAALVVGVVGIALSGIATTVLAQGALRSGLTTVLWILLAIAAIALLLRVAPRAFRERIGAHHAWPPAPAMARAFAAYATNYVVIGIGTWLMALLLLPDRHHDIGLLVASFAIAWVAGFFAPGAPAGLGIREALMLLVLRAAYPAPDALLLVVGMRLATILADVAIFLAGNAAVLHARRRAASP